MDKEDLKSNRVLINYIFFQKVKRRTQGLDQKRSYNPTKKKETRDVLRIEFMSSDEVSIFVRIYFKLCNSGSDH